MINTPNHNKNDYEHESIKVDINVTNRTLIRIIAIIVASFLLILLFSKLTHSILLIFIAFFLALFLNAPVSRLARFLPGKRKGSRSMATTLSFLLVIVLLAIFASYVIPPLIQQTEKFIAVSPRLINETKNQHTTLGHFIRHHNLEAFVGALSHQISIWVKHIGDNAFSSITKVLDSIVSMLAILVLTFMMLVEGPRWVNFFKQSIVPKKQSSLMNKLLDDMYVVIKGYVNGQVLLAFIAAILIAPALFILHISYPIALIVVVFLAGLIPVIGHTIGAVIISIVALFHSLPAAIIILIYYIFYMQVENYLLQPRIQANTTNMSPLLVFIAIILGLNFGGLVGGLVAIPIAACLRVVILEYLDYKRILNYHGSTNNASKIS